MNRSQKSLMNTQSGEAFSWTLLTLVLIPPKDPAPGLKRAPLPRRGPAHLPPHLRGHRSAVAPGPHLEGGNGGVLDHVRPKGLGFCGIPQWHWIFLAVCRLVYGNSDLQKCLHSLPCSICCICTCMYVFMCNWMSLADPADCSSSHGVCVISGAVAIPLDPPILTPVQKRNNLITVFKQERNLACCVSKKTTTSIQYIVHFHRTSKSYFS